MKRLIGYILGLIAMMLMGCGEIAPSKDELAGIWINKDGAEIKLNSDGTFTAKSLPAELFFIPSDKYSGEKFDGCGVWKIKMKRKSWDQFPWSVNLDFQKASNPKYLWSGTILISGSGFLENRRPWNNLFLWKEEEGGERYELKKR